MLECGSIELETLSKIIPCEKLEHIDCKVLRLSQGAKFLLLELVNPFSSEGASEVRVD